MALCFCFALLVVLSPIFAGVVAAANIAEELKSCWNAHYDATPSTLTEWISGQPARLAMVDAWWSPRKSGLPLTIFTMTSLDRLPMLEAMCRDYAGPLSAAVYIPIVVGGGGEATFGAGPSAKGAAAAAAAVGAGASGDISSSGGSRRHLLDPLTDARTKLQDLFNRLEQEAAAAAANGSGSSGCCCQPRLLLLAERLSDRALAAIMPTNAMRNAAMLGATTPLTAMFDVDLAPGGGLNEQMRNITWVEKAVQELSGYQPVMYIAPAFEAEARLSVDMVQSVVHSAITGDKQTVVSLWRRAKLQAFQIDICRHCHGFFNHIRWATANTPYAARYSPGFEPWGILWRRRDPGYDERFRGWLYDKQMHVEALVQKHRFELHVLPDIWLVHRPHKKVAIAQIQRTEATGGGEKAKVQLKGLNDDVAALLEVVRFENGTVTSPYRLYREYVDPLRLHVRTALAAHQPYEPQQNAQFLHCKSVLSWWQEH